MTKLTRDQMEALQLVHEAAEFDLDLDAVMETLVDNPVYEIPALGWHIEGQDAVRETYRRMLPGADKVNMWADRRAHATSDTELCREAYVYFDTPEGRKTGHYFVLMEFEGDRIRGERMYMCDTYAKAMADVLGPDFGEIPGVSKLQDKAPAPGARIDRAAALADNQIR